MVRENIKTTFVAENGTEEKEFDFYFDAVIAEEKYLEEQLEINLRKYFPKNYKSNCVDCETAFSDGQESFKFLDSLRCESCHKECFVLFQEIIDYNIELDPRKWSWTRLIFMFTDFEELHNNDLHKIKEVYKIVKNWDNYQKEL